MRTVYLPDIVGGGYRRFWDCRLRYRVIKGGKASKKSSTTALWYIYHLMKYPGANLLVVRAVHRTQVVPEVDAYVLSKLSGFAVTANQTITGTPEEDAFAMLSDAIAKAQNAVGYDEELVAFVDGKMLSAIQNSADISRHLVMNDFKKGELHTQVTSLNGVAILPVPDSRMKTAYEFFDGTTSGQEAGGFTPADNAKSVGLLLLPRRAASLIKKTEQVRCFDPAHNLKADAWKLDYRLYYDVVIKDSLKSGVYAYVY